MECNDSKEREFLADIEIGEAHQADPVSSGKWGKKSLNKLVSGVLGFNGLACGGHTANTDGASAEYPNETTRLLVEECDQVNVDKKKSGKVKKAPKPPRPPRGPSLDASDMRMIKEFSNIAMKKRERIERIKELKKMRAARIASSSSLSSSCSTVLAMVITILFFLVLIFQGLGSSSRPNIKLTGAPQSAPETRGLAPVQSYKTFLSDDGAAPSFLPPESTH